MMIKDQQKTEHIAALTELHLENRLSVDKLQFLILLTASLKGYT